mmetsp:Transcript_62757/g.147162  ORF Transcript_62757/g.147162 Transcript_62757/m.147162 type:complete len:84 (-) Transcript_62757:7-258(-)
MITTIFGTSLRKAFLLAGHAFLESAKVGPMMASEGMGGKGRSEGGSCADVKPSKVKVIMLIAMGLSGLSAQLAGHYRTTTHRT